MIVLGAVQACTLFTLLEFVVAGFSEFPYGATGSSFSGSLAAFSDVNADKAVDVLLVSGNTVSAVLASSNPVEWSQVQLLLANGSVLSVVPADFDGDLKNDLLVTSRSHDNKTVCSVFFQDAGLTFGSTFTFENQFVDEPLVLDYNGDMRPDILVETAPGQRKVYIALPTRNFSEVSAFSDFTDKEAFIRPHANSYMDWNGDWAADLILPTKSHIEVWFNQKGTFAAKPDKLVPYPNGFALGQTAITDFDADGKIDMLAIASANGIDSLQMWRSNSKEFEPIRINLAYNGLQWRFAAADGNPPRLVIGDYDNDGFPDAVALLESQTTTRERYAVPIKNVPCLSLPECTDSSSRAMEVMWAEMLTGARNATAAAFYDTEGNGVLDILVSVDVDGKGQELQIYKNDKESLSSFLKVMVVSSLCEGSCMSLKPFTNQPGASVRYSSVHTDGTAATAVGAQLYQTAHLALLLPYVTFGLGEMPNFIDTLDVGIPPTADQEKWSREWTMVIPNAHVVVLPYPPSDPSRWQQKLFIMPGRPMMVTGIVLLSLCAVAAAVIGGLHLYEKREDRDEQRQESQRFHFNAM